MQADDAPTPEALAHELGVGFSALILRAPETFGGAHGFGEGAVEILIPRNRRAAAMRRLDAMNWSYRVGASGSWRVFPAANFWWPGPVNLFVYWGLPAHPFPAAALARLERALWAGAKRHPPAIWSPTRRRCSCTSRFRRHAPARTTTATTSSTSPPAVARSRTGTA